MKYVKGARGVDRRSFLRLAGASTFGLSIALEACAAPAPSGGAPTSAPVAPTGVPAAVPPVTPTVAAASTSVAAASTPASAARLKLPTYVPIQGATPDLPPTPQGLQAGYFTYPQTLVQSVTQTPGSAET